jgi:RsmE family RNA methyltransferase
MHEVHRASVGDSLRVGEINGLMGHGTITQLSATRATLEIELGEEPPAKLPVTLVLALPRPKMLRRILRSVAEFGARELHLINSYRVEKSYWQTPTLQPEQIRHYQLLGLEQACDTMLIEVHQHTRFKPWVEDELPALAKNKRTLLCHLDDAATAPTKSASETLAVIGPEGGFIEYEIDKFLETNFETVSLGRRTLRVENAVSALLANLS